MGITWGFSLLLALGTASGVAVYGVFAPRSSLFGRVVYRGPRSLPARVALTFDDGPSADLTPKLLDQLAELQVQAAFFVIGRNAERHPELVRRMDAEGHLIAGHSYDHSAWGMFYRHRYWRAQLTRTEQTLAAITGKRPALFRPPMGLKHPALLRVLQERGLTLVTWSRRALDGVPTSSESILQRLAPRARPGDILALHDGHRLSPAVGNDATLRALPPLVAALRNRGLQPVRLDELIGVAPYLSGPVRRPETSNWPARQSA
jgi:peptidoglycan/xylan/chitin deacetylase (PgdA/CDA1 family)